MEDETTSRSQRRRQHVLDAIRPIGSNQDVGAELERLQGQIARAEEALVHHRRVHRYATGFPWFFPYRELRARIQRAEDKRLSSAEDLLSEEALGILYRASSIVQQLRARAAGVDATALLAGDLAEVLVMQALTLKARTPSAGEPAQDEFDTFYAAVSISLRDVRIGRLDHSMDELIEQGRVVAVTAAKVHAQISRAQRDRRRQ